MKEEDSTSRRRETPADVMVRRAARQLVAPLNEQIGLLQSEAVKLEAMARRSRAPGKIDPALTDATKVMLETLTVYSATFSPSTPG